MSVAEIAGQFPISRPAISQHLRVLKDAGLVTDVAVATRRMYELSPTALKSLRDHFDEFWSAALGEFKRHAESRRRTSRRRSA